MDKKRAARIKSLMRGVERVIEHNRTRTAEQRRKEYQSDELVPL